MTSSLLFAWRLVAHRFSNNYSFRHTRCLSAFRSAVLKPYKSALLPRLFGSLFPGAWLSVLAKKSISTAVAALAMSWLNLNLPHKTISSGLAASKIYIFIDTYTPIELRSYFANYRLFRGEVRGGLGFIFLEESLWQGRAVFWGIKTS